jgi:hypothetical protein
MTTNLTQTYLTELKRNFAANPAAYDAIVSAAERSPFFAGILNAFHVPDANGEVPRMGLGAPDQGTFATSRINIFIDPNMMPGSGHVNSQVGDVFASVIAHELGHAVLPAGFGFQGGTGANGSLANPDEASMSGRIIEGVANTAEWIVARQLGSPGYSMPGFNQDQVYLRDVMLRAYNGIAIDTGPDIVARELGSPRFMRLCLLSRSGKTSKRLTSAGHHVQPQPVRQA